MATTDTIPMQAIDIREASSDWLLSCPTHGQIHMAIQFNGDWARTYCQDCFEASLASVSKVTASTKPGAPALKPLV